jgi:hypothetical protein
MRISVAQGRAGDVSTVNATVNIGARNQPGLAP